MAGGVTTRKRAKPPTRSADACGDAKASGTGSHAPIEVAQRPAQVVVYDVSLKCCRFGHERQQSAVVLDGHFPFKVLHMLVRLRKNKVGLRGPSLLRGPNRIGAQHQR